MRATFFLVALLAMAAPRPQRVTAPIGHNAAIGYDIDPAVDARFTARIDALDPLYVRHYLGLEKIAPTPDRRTWGWSYSDRIINFNFRRGRKIILCIFPYPAWMASLPEHQWMQTRSEIVSNALSRYAGKIYALESCNEPCAETRPDQTWGYIPGITNDQGALIAKLLAIYQADKLAVKGTSIKLAGPTWTAYHWDNITKKLFDAGAPLDICTFHCYGAPPEKLYEICLSNKTAASGRQTFCDEFALFKQETSTTITTAQAQQQIRDARTAALAFKQTGVVPFPHTLMQRSANAFDGGYAGYEWAPGHEPFVMKGWAREFISILRTNVAPK